MSCNIKVLGLEDIQIVSGWLIFFGSGHKTSSAMAVQREW